MERRREAFLSEGRWERLAPLTGIVAVVLVIVGFIVFESGDTPDSESSPEQVASYFENDQGTIIGGTFVTAIGLLFFIWFLGSLRSRLYRAEGGVGRVSSVAFAAGVAMATLLFAGLAPVLSGAFAFEEDERLTPESAQALWNAGDGFFFLAWFAGALLLAATAVVGLRTGVFARWFSFVTLVLAVAFVVPWIGWAVFLFAFPLWIVVVSLWLWRTREPDVRLTPPPTESPAAAP